MAKFEDFYIGCNFAYEEDAWVCVGIGTTYVLAKFTGSEIAEYTQPSIFEPIDFPYCTIEGG